MNELFLKIVNMSISASWLVLAVLILRLVLKKAPKWVNVLLWGIVAVRLLCPFSIESALSLIPSAETFPEKVISGPSFDVQTGIAPVDNRINDYLGDRYYEGVTVPANNGFNIMTALTIVWIIGILLLVAYTAISYRRLHRKIDTAVLYRDNIFQSEYVSSPFVLGIIKPRIYLPFNMDGQGLEHVVAHEQAHIRRKDHWWKPLGFLLLTIHWFNPLMWLAYVLLCRDIELACDEKVIKGLGSEKRADYTQALVACSVDRRMIAACPLAFGEVGVKERVKSVMNYKKPAFWIVILAVVSCVVVAICFLTNPATNRDSLKWAQKLSVEDVASADLVIFPQTEDKQFKNLSNEELTDMVDLINQSKGKYQSEHEELDGGSIFFYISMKDGTSHKVGNMGNTYLFIDGDYYEADCDWLVTWDSDFGEGNSPLPNGYFSKPSILKWFDYTSDPAGMDWDNEITTEIPEFPGITFRYTPEQIIASKNFPDTDMAGHSILIAGMPIWNAYFTDLTGDGCPEICTTLSYGSGIIDTRIVIHDYVNDVSYELADRGNYDYTLHLNNEDGGLYVDKRVYPNGEMESSGRLVFRDDCIQILYTSKGNEAETISPIQEVKSIPGNYDFDQDGVPEVVELMTHFDNATRYTWFELLIKKADGTLLWKEEAHTAHAGYNSLFACVLDGKDYLLQYTPTMYQGSCIYAYHLFALDAQGNIQPNREASVSFDINWGSPIHDEFDATEIADFMDEVNSLLANSKLLLSTDTALEDIDPEHPQDIPWWLRDEDFCSGYIYDESKTLRENLLELERIVSD